MSKPILSERKLLLFCYAGFTVATLACVLSDSAATLLWARAICGAFGGVSGFRQKNIADKLRDLRFHFAS